MAGANRFMEPAKAQYMQTYVSQYVPKPFELMQRAADNAQAHYDAVSANMEQQRAFLGKLSSHSGTDTRDLEALQDVYQKELDKIMQSGDLRFAEDQVRQLGQHLGKNYRSGALGKYVASGTAEKEYFAAKKEAETKKLGEGAWSAERGTLLSDYHKRWNTAGYEGDFDKNVLTKTHRGSPNINKLVSDLGKDVTEDTIRDNPFFNSGKWGEYQTFLDTNYKGIELSKAQKAIVGGLYQDSDVVEEARIRAAVRHGGDSPSLYYDNVSKDEIKAEILEMAKPGVTSITHSVGDSKASVHKTPDFAGAEERAKKPIINYSVAHESEPTGIQKTTDVKKMNEHIESTKDAMVKETNLLIQNFKEIPGLQELVENYNINLKDPEDVMSAMNNPIFRKAVLENSSKDLFDKYTRLETDYNNAIQRDREAENEAKTKNEALYNGKVNYENFVKSKFGYTDEEAKIRGLSSVDNVKRAERLEKLGFKINIFNGLQGAEEELKEALATETDLVKKKAYSDYLKDSKELTKLRDAAEKADGYIRKTKDAYLERTSDAFVKTTSGSTKVPIYKIDDNGKVVIDKDASDEATRSLREIVNVKNINTLNNSTVRYKGGDEWEEATLGDYLKQAKIDGQKLADEENQDYKLDIGLPTIGKTVDVNGKRYIQINIDDKSVNMALTDTNFKQIRDQLNKPQTVTYKNIDDEMVTTTINPSKVNDFMFKAYKSGLVKRKLPNNLGTIVIPRDAMQKSQGGTNTFMNDAAFKINTPKGILTGNKAYYYLANLESKGLLR